MINRQMVKAKALVEVVEYDKYGKSKSIVYKFLYDLRIAINLTSINKQNADIRYKEATHIGLTSFKMLKNDRKYKIVVDDKEYIVISINNTARLAQLVLKEIITDRKITPDTPACFDGEVLLNGAITMNGKFV